MKPLLNKLSFFFLFTAIGCQSNKSKVDPQPNIIFILADDLGVPQLGCYGSEFYETPNIDRLAENGIRFTDAYAAAAVCSPTRASLMTGKYPATLHITDFIPGDEFEDSLLKQPDWQRYLPLEEITFGEVLKENGYATALFGKWHLSKDKTPPASFKYNPDKQGFDEIFVTFKPSNSLPVGSWQVPENDAHNVDTITSLAIDFITRNRDNQFFVMLSHNSIHDPLMAKDSLINKYKNKKCIENPENNALWGAMVETLDKSVGRLVEAVENEQLAENTIIVFYSDNGAKHDYASQAPFRKGKGWLYEGGIRVPLIVSWPGKIAKNKTSGELVSSMDFFDTFLDFAQISDTVTSRDGQRFTQFLYHPESTPNRQLLYWNYPHYHKGSGMKPACAIRSGDYKLIQWYEEWLTQSDGALELYDLKNDPGEHTNLVNTNPELADSLLLVLEDIKLQTNSQIPSIR